MKLNRLLIWTIFCMLSFSGSAQRMLSEVSSVKGVTAVYVGKPLLQVSGKSMSISPDKTSVDVSKLVKNLTSIEYFMCENRTVGKEVGKMCRDILSKYPFEIITQASDDAGNMTISGVYDKNGKDLKMILISADNIACPIYVLMCGKIDINTLSEAIIVTQSQN